MKQEIDITMEIHEEIVLLDLQGDLTTLSETFLKKAYEDANNHGTGKIILKFDEAAYINSGGLALLIQILAEAKKNDQIIAITGLSKHFQKIFNMVGITKIANIYNTLEEAFENLS